MDDDFESQVARQMERLTSLSYREIEAQVAARRVAWYPGTRPAGLPTPRDAYELFLIDYLGLPREQVPIVSETEHEIVWRSYNPCPTLEACLRLGLDTRVVCRAAYEQPVQALISLLDPALRFGRSYEQIRPHAPYCTEWITR